MRQIGILDGKAQRGPVGPGLCGQWPANAQQQAHALIHRAADQGLACAGQGRPGALVDDQQIRRLQGLRRQPGVVPALFDAAAQADPACQRAAGIDDPAAQVFAFGIGATDQQIAGLFQRRITIDTAYGVALGTAVAAAILLLIGWQWSGVTSGLAATASLGPMGWALLLALPLLAIALAALTARQTLLAALKKIL